MPFVVDASVALCWAFDDEDHPTLALTLERIRTDQAHVPSLWWFEVCSALIYERRKSMNGASASQKASLRPFSKDLRAWM